MLLALILRLPVSNLGIKTTSNRDLQMKIRHVGSWLLHPAQAVFAIEPP